jgi:hypothetical protein
MYATPSNGPSATMRTIWGIFGLFFAFLTMRVLLWEVHGFHEMQPEHWLTIGAMVGAVSGGIYFWQMLWAGKLLTATGLAIAFCGATIYCLVGSAGRGDDAAYRTNAEAQHVNEVRSQVKRDLVEAKSRYEAALTAETGECSGGAGPRCKAKREQTTLRRVEVDAAERKVRELPPEQRENGKLKRAAEIVSLVRGTEVATAERALAILWPFIPPSVCELLTISFLHLAFVPHRGGGNHVRVEGQSWWRRRQKRLELPAPDMISERVIITPPPVRTPETAVAEPVSFHLDTEHRKPVVSKPKRVRPTDVQLMHEAINRLGGVANSQDELAEAMSVGKSEVSKRVRACGDFVLVQRVGNCHRVIINPAYEYV